MRQVKKDGVEVGRGIVLSEVQGRLYRLRRIGIAEFFEREDHTEEAAANAR